MISITSLQAIHRKLHMRKKITLLILLPLLSSCAAAQVLQPMSLQQKLGSKLIPLNLITANQQCVVIKNGAFAHSLTTEPCIPTLKPQWIPTEQDNKLALQYIDKDNQLSCLVEKNNNLSVGSCDDKNIILLEEDTTNKNHYKLRTEDNQCLTLSNQNKLILASCNLNLANMTFQISPNRVKVTGGEIAGLQFGNTARFMGIPYAQAPKNKLRFMPPQPLENDSWQGPLLAYQPSFMCPQKNFSGDYFGNEDCLYLNVWTSQDAVMSNQSKPVMVWIHGGALAIGGSYYGLPGHTKNYNGKKLSELGDVVIVSINYRLGTLGLLGNKGKFKGNNSLRDQIAALQWVHNNISKFGGDPNNVTLFGESAGAWSICSILAAPSADKLFQKAIMESGACTSRTIEDNNVANEWLIKKLNCWHNGDTAKQEQCLLNYSPQELTQAWVLTQPKSAEIANAFVIAPYVDGDILPQPPLELFKEGKINKPLINGVNKKEFANFSWILSLMGVIDFNNSKLLESLVDNPQAKAYVAPALEYYKKNNKGEGDLIDDILFKCINWQLSNSMANHNKVNYSYLFDMPFLFDFNIHTEEIPYVFQQKNNAVARELGLYWTHFAHTGTPNFDTQKLWPKQKKEQLTRLVIDKNTKVFPWKEEERCKLLQKFVPWTVIGRNAGWLPTKK